MGEVCCKRTHHNACLPALYPWIQRLRLRLRLRMSPAKPLHCPVPPSPGSETPFRCCASESGRLAEKSTRNINHHLLFAFGSEFQDCHRSLSLKPRSGPIHTEARERNVASAWRSIKNGNNCCQGGCSHMVQQQQHCANNGEFSIFCAVTHHASCVDRGWGGSAHDHNDDHDICDSY